MPNRILRTLALVLLFATTATGTLVAGTPLKAELEQTRCRQGGFFVVRAESPGGKPVVRFMEREWEMFRQEEGWWQALVPVENLTGPGHYTLEVTDGTARRETEVEVRGHGLGVQHITLSPSKSSLHATAIEKRRVKEALRTVTPERLFASGFLRPSEGETSSIFGRPRSYNGGPATSYHKGVDIAAPKGAPVRATAGGRVVLAGTVEEGFAVHGNTVILDHGEGLTSVYLHLDSVSVAEGARVEKGDLVGRVGHTGISTAPHLHWGMYLYGISVDPELFLVRRPAFLRATR